MSDYPEVGIVQRLLELAARYGLEELEVEEGGLKVSLEAREPGADGEGMPAGAGRAYPLWNPSELFESEGPSHPESARPLLAPLSGIFYRADAPDADPFVEEGQTVEAGARVGLIEAMKVFSPIEADVAGTVLEIVARNGQLVQHGEVLLYLDPVAT